MLKNAYILGVLIILSEAIINLLIGQGATSGVVVAFVAGYIYSMETRLKMPKLERLKTTLVYIILAGGIAAVSLLSSITNSTLAIVGIVFILIYGIFVYLGLTFGSYMYIKYIEKLEKKNIKNGTSKTGPTVNQLLLFLVVIVLIAAAVSFYFRLGSTDVEIDESLIGENIQQEEQTDVLKQQENKEVVVNSNLKKYSNSMFGYSFLYPTDWSVEQRGDIVALFSDSSDSLALLLGMTDRVMIERNSGIIVPTVQDMSVSGGILKIAHLLTFDFDLRENILSEKKGGQAAYFEYPDLEYVTTFTITYDDEDELVSYKTYASSRAKLIEIMQTLKVDRAVYQDGVEKQQKIQEEFLKALHNQ